MRINDDCIYKRGRGDFFSLAVLATLAAAIVSKHIEARF